MADVSGHERVAVMDAMELLRTRVSASKLGGPRPSAEVMHAVLECAARVPDHGRLQPWRLLLIEGEARLEFGEVLAEALSRRNPPADEQALAREREKALRAPLIIVVATRCDRSSRIPIVEQFIAAGCAAHALMLGAFAQGLGAFWRTGESAYDEAVKAALDISSDDLIIGFIYVGIDTGGAPSRPRPGVCEFAQRWTGASPRQAMPRRSLLGIACRGLAPVQRCANSQTPGRGRDGAPPAS